MRFWGLTSWGRGPTSGEARAEGVHVDALLLGEADAARHGDDAPLNTDDRLTLEFSAARTLYLETARAAAQQMLKYRAADLPEVTPSSRPELEQPDARRWIGMDLLGRGATEDAARFRAVEPARPPHPALSLAEGERAGVRGHAGHRRRVHE